MLNSHFVSQMRWRSRWNSGYYASTTGISNHYCTLSPTWRLASVSWTNGWSDIFNVVLFDKETHEIFNKKVILVKEFRSPVRNKEGFVFECIGGSSFKDGNPVNIAQSELKEETGIEIDPLRFKACGTRQVASTLSAHHAVVYAAALSKDEINKIEESVKNKTFGVAEDTEKTYVVVCKVQDLLDGKIPVDWANLGMILSAILEQA
jgi:ADP-ribose pyrophosphatase YjhB (NUDIX family)